MNPNAIVAGTFGIGAAAINGFSDCVGLAAWRIKCGFVAVLNGVDEIFDHRVMNMAMFVAYFGIQDVLKDPDVQTLIASPASIRTWAWSTWAYIGIKALLPMIGGVIAYKSDTWARKGRQVAGIAQPKDFPPPAGTDPAAGQVAAPNP